MKSLIVSFRENFEQLRADVQRILEIDEKPGVMHVTWSRIGIFGGWMQIKLDGGNVNAALRLAHSRAALDSRLVVKTEVEQEDERLVGDVEDV